MSLGLKKNISMSIFKFFLCSHFFFGYVIYSAAKQIQFNTDVLDLKDRENIDLSQFSQQGFILPGSYDLALNLNNQLLQSRTVTFLAPDDNPKGSVVCINREIVDQLGLTKTAQRDLTWWNNGECLQTNSLKGLQTHTDLGKGILYLTVPQVHIEYTNANWDPPALWEDGIPGILLDYNLNTQVKSKQHYGDGGYNFSGNGLTGANLGAWRIRAGWQTKIDNQNYISENNRKKFEWTQYYAYRAIKPLRAKLTLGEDYLNSDIFDSFRYTGVSLVSDDNMLPPNMRGYAPEVTGVARGNAKVVISQQGRVIKEVLVASGPFRIQDLDSAVSGKLDVRVEEDDGNVQSFQVDTATIPYLTRPGQVRFKITAGRPSTFGHGTDGEMFTTGEFSWGISNGWSLYGGALTGNQYSAVSLGFGRDLMAFGALSSDVTRSYSKLEDGDRKYGDSYRLSYSKHFDEIGSRVTFAGYRFTDSNFMSLSEHMSRKSNPSNQTTRSKEMYTISLSQEIESLALSGYLNYNHQTYWNQSTSDRYDISLAKNFDIGNFRNISASLSAYRNNFGGLKDDGMYFSVSLPFGTSGMLGYTSSLAAGNDVHSVSYSDRVGDSDSYSLRAGITARKSDFSGYYSHLGDLAQINATATYRGQQYSSAGISLSGGGTITNQGGALHRNFLMGGTRILVDTDGVSGIPVGGFGSAVHSNEFGKAVVVDVNSYYRNSVRVDIDKLAENANTTGSVLQTTLTEGAIGYRHFDIIAGEKSMVKLRLVDGSAPPFGSTVYNSKKQETGMVNDDGNVFLSGIKSREKMFLYWDNIEQCSFTLPENLDKMKNVDLILPCDKI